MQRERNRLIAEALAAPPPEPAQCTLRALHLGGAPFIRVQLRVPAEGHLNRCHIRTAHDVARAQTSESETVALVIEPIATGGPFERSSAPLKGRNRYQYVTVPHGALPHRALTKRASREHANQHPPR